MSELAAHHDTIRIERTFEASPERVFAAWAEPDARSRWNLPVDEWQIVEAESDFRVGGHEMRRFGAPGGPVYLEQTHYEDIVPDARIVFAYTMSRDGTRISVSLTTVELSPAGMGTHMRFTEQAVFLDGGDTAPIRERGWKTNLANLEAELRGRLANDD